MTHPYGVLSLLVLAVALVASVHQVGAADPVGRWRPLIEQAAARHGVPSDVLLAMLSVESGGDPAAVGAAGEIGLLQILPSTGRLLGVTPAQLRDPAINIDTAARYLAIELRATGGDVRAAVQGYNGGSRARYNPLPSTRAYATKVLSVRQRAAPVVARVMRSRWAAVAVPQ